MQILKRICHVLIALILVTMLLPPSPVSAAVRPVFIQSGQSEETAVLAPLGTTLRQAQDSGQGTKTAKARALEAYGASVPTERSAGTATLSPGLALSVADDSGQSLPAGVSADILKGVSWWATVQEDIRQSEYHVTWQDHTYLPDLPAPSAGLKTGAYQAPNRAHNLRTYFTPAGIRVIPRMGDPPTWEWGLTLTGYGYVGDVQPVVPAELVATGNRIEYRRGNLTEWYVNGERGLEQGFTLAASPQSAIRNPQSEIVLELALTGDLTPNLTDDGAAIEFITPPSASSGQGGGVRVLRYSDLHAYDATGRTLPVHFSPSLSHLSIWLDDTAAVYPITVDPLATTPNWTAEGNQDNATLGFAVSTAGDVNGDGFADVIVGASRYDHGQTDEGRAYVYYGSVAGLSTTADWTAESDQAVTRFGRAVGTAGDVNGDGYADVIVGARWYDNGETDEGAAFVYYGSVTGLDANGTRPSGTPANADWTVESDQAGGDLGADAVGTAGDVNGDGYADVVVGAGYYDNGENNEGAAFVYYGSATGLDANGVRPGGTPANADWMAEGDQAGAVFGHYAGTAGDVNGDGYADVIVGAHWYDNGQTNEGRAYVYHGSATGLSTTADWTAEGDQAYAQFGSPVDTAGDVNGDGYADVIVGAAYYGDSSENDEGRAYVYYGSSTGLTTGLADWTVESNQAGAQLGVWVGTAGDVNGDGYADVIVGARHYNNGQADEGTAYVYRGSATGLDANGIRPSGTPANADWAAESDQAGAEFGAQVGTAGDVNGDGYADVIVGAPSYDNGETNEGRAYVYHGSAAGLATTPNWTAEGNQDNATLGFAVSTAGDVNGDGYSDVIVGACAYDHGQTDEGRAYVYYGSAAGLSTTADWTAESDQAVTRFGRAVGTAGDVNGDGYADVIVGARWYDNGETDEGAAFVYYGSVTGLDANGTRPSGTPANADWTVESDQAGGDLGADAVGTAGDVNGDGYADVVVGAGYYDNGENDEGAAFVYYGSATGLDANGVRPGGTPANADWMAEGDQAGAVFGHYAGTAGDVNGDGYADVIVGAMWYNNGQTNEGRAYVYHGSVTGLSTTADWTVESDQAYAHFGHPVDTAGDVNGDGYADVIVGAPYYDNSENDEGRAYVYHGSSTGLTTGSADWTVESNQAGAQLGAWVGTAGDVNGDGYADVIVGARHYNNGQADEGTAYVYRGSATGLDANGIRPSGTPANADWAAESDQADAEFGAQVGTAGDVNGDGYADVIVGALYYDNGETNEGRAFVYYGNEGDGLDLTPRQMRTDGSAHIAPLGMSDSATAVQLRLTGRMPLGREKVKLQWQVATLGTPFTDPSVISGTSVNWTDTLTTGMVITQNVTGLTPGTPYHWRVRLLYWPGNRLGQPAGRWIHIPWNGWTEQDFRTSALLPDTNTVYLPLVLKSPAPDLPDLVGSFSLSPDQLNFAGEPVQITVVITNQGAATAGPFWADFFINPSTPPTAANMIWNDYCGMTPCYGLAWYVSNSLAPGESITLTSTPDSYSEGHTIWPGSFASGTTDLYLYVDTWNPGVATGAVAESDETNNRDELHGLVVTGANAAQNNLPSAADLPPRPVRPSE